MWIMPSTAIRNCEWQCLLGLVFEIAMLSIDSGVLTGGSQSDDSEAIHGHVGTHFSTDLYSYRSASMGSNRAAFLAGQTPNISPMAIDTVKPVMTAHNGMAAGKPGTSAITR